jgi:lipocalin
MYPHLKVVSCHPGWTLTEGVEAAYGSGKSMLEPLRTLWQGAEGIIWLCVASHNKIEGGAFYLDRSPRTKHISGPFFTEGTFTKNSEAEVDMMMLNLQRWCQAMWRPSPEITAAKIASRSRDCVASTIPVDIPSFMGQWMVIANIPTSLEIGTTDNYENYELEEETNVVKIRFQYNAKGSKEPSNVHMRASIANPPVNSYWTLSPKLLGIHWPIGLQYLLLERGFAGDNLEYCIVGVPKRTNLWIMTRRRPRAKSSLTSTNNSYDFGVDEDLENISIMEKKNFNGKPILSAAEEKKIMKMAIDFSEKIGYDCSNIVMVGWSSYTG